MGGSNLSSLSNSKKWGSFEERYAEFELVGGSPALLVSDEGVRGVGAEGDGSLLFARKVGGLCELGLFLSGRGRYSMTTSGFSPYTQSDSSSLEHKVQGRFASHLCIPPPNRNQYHNPVSKGGGIMLTLFFLLMRRMRGVIDQWLCIFVEPVRGWCSPTWLARLSHP